MVWLVCEVPIAVTHMGYQPARSLLPLIGRRLFQ